VERAGPRIYIRWSPTTTPEIRTQLEAKYHLKNPFFREGRTWIYELADVSRDNVAAIVHDPYVEDTLRIDRTTFEILIPPDELTPTP
jgi:hypothetical protein